MKAEAFINQHSDLVAFMDANANWNNFFASLTSQLRAGRGLSENQTAAAYSSMIKIKTKEAVKTEAVEAGKTEAQTVDLSSIKRMFDNAAASGLKRLAYRANGLIISPAASSGRNPGALYVKTEKSGDYQGKVFENTFHPTFSCTDATKEALNEIAKNPGEAARLYGRNTGRCACCGKELTNAVSIEMGIGPICAGKWGI